MATIPPSPAGDQTKGDWWHAVRVLDEPTRVFRSLAARPRWLFPVVLLVAVSGVVAFGTPTTTLRSQVEAQLQSVQQQNPDRVPPEARERALERAGSLSNRLLIFGGGAALGLASLVIVAAVLQLLFGAAASRTVSFRDELAVVAHAQMPQLLGAVLVVAVVAALKLEQLTLSLGFLFDADESPFLARVGEQLTFFGAWKVYLLAAGNRVLTGGKTVTGPLAIVGGLWVLVAVGVAAVVRLLVG